jgi:hypothetical protein
MHTLLSFAKVYPMCSKTLLDAQVLPLLISCYEITVPLLAFHLEFAVSVASATAAAAASSASSSTPAKRSKSPSSQKTTSPSTSAKRSASPSASLSSASAAAATASWISSISASSISGALVRHDPGLRYIRSSILKLVHIIMEHEYMNGITQAVDKRDNNGIETATDRWSLFINQIVNLSSTYDISGIDSNIRQVIRPLLLLRHYNRVYDISAVIRAMIKSNNAYGITRLNQLLATVRRSDAPPSKSSKSGSSSGTSSSSGSGLLNQLQAEEKKQRGKRVNPSNQPVQAPVNLAHMVSPYSLIHGTLSLLMNSHSG